MNKKMKEQLNFLFFEKLNSHLRGDSNLTSIFVTKIL